MRAADRKRHKGQMVIGYILLFILVIAALMTMGSYIRNSMSGKIRQTGDTIGAGGQYDPGEGYGYHHTGATTDTHGDD